MQHGFTYEAALEASQRVNWRLEDVIGGDKRLDFARPFMPESLARVAPLDFLDAAEARLLNQIRGHGYLYLFGTVEEFILPFVMDHARPQLHGDDARIRALLQFAAEEAKHIHLFKQFRAEFRAGFGVECGVIGPPQEIARHVLAHHPLGIALVILHLEWMTQRHWVDSIHDDGGLDPQFKSLLRHHWMEEAQHAKVDTLTIEAMVAACSASDVAAGIADYAAIGGFLDDGLRQQAELDTASFERAVGRKLGGRERSRMIEGQHQAMRWTFLGSGMTHPRFLDTLGQIDPAARRQVETMAQNLC
ncbi:MAG TPA: hypothetical protein VGR62_11145 [Candidatus Binatia bacterium]|jgi:hypothetical protein|nr:hypothetical protein [Candidatus Binatia bacterium]